MTTPHGVGADHHARSARSARPTATIGPVGATPYETSASAELQAAITTAFGGYDAFWQAVNTTSATQWGPGFSWACVMRDTGDLMLTTTPLQVRVCVCV